MNLSAHILSKFHEQGFRACVVVREPEHTNAHRILHASELFVIHLRRIVG